MNNCCAFCGLAPLDGKPCCTPQFQRGVMRRADATIKARDAELAALRAELDGHRRCREVFRDALFAIEWKNNKWVVDNEKLTRALEVLNTDRCDAVPRWAWVPSEQRWIDLGKKSHE